MTDLRQAAQQALDALECMIDDLMYKDHKRVIDISNVAITALKAALEQQAEPVATVTSETGNPDITMSWWHEPALPVGTKLYTTPPQPKPLMDEMVHKAMIALNTASFGEFQPTFEEMKAAIEAAHGIKEQP